MIRFFIFIASVLVASNFAFDAETELVIDNIVENIFMENNRIPGLGVSVVRNGTVLMSKGYGMKNISAGLASDGNTLFAIGSITKVKNKIKNNIHSMIALNISKLIELRSSSCDQNFK